MTGRRTTVVVHPGVQHSADLAAALDDAGVLSLLVTGLQIGVDAPSPWQGATARRLLRRRIHSRLPDSRIRRVHPLAFAAVRALRRTPRLQQRLQAWVDGRPFASAVLRRLPPDTTTVVATDYGAGPLFDALARERPGIRRVLDVSHPADVVRRRLLEADAERWGRPVEHYDDHTGAPVLDQREEYELADVLVVASRFSADQLLLRRPGVRVEVIPYGVSTGEPPPPRDPIGDRPARLVFVGAISERKGISFLLQAAEQLAGEGVTVDVVGREAGGYRLPSLPANVRHHAGLDRAGVERLIAKADLLVLPSMCEGFGRVLLEALALGVPVLATVASGAPDILARIPDAPVTVIGLDDRADLSAHIRAALEAGPRDPQDWFPGFVAEFSEVAYRHRWDALLADRVDRSGNGGGAS